VVRLMSVGTGGGHISYATSRFFAVSPYMGGGEDAPVFSAASARCNFGTCSLIFRIALRGLAEGD